MRAQPCVFVTAVALMLAAQPVNAADKVTLEDVKTEWQNLYGAIVYAASGTIKNGGTAPVRAVKVRIELFDKDGKPVAQREGYNLSAEALEEAPGDIDKVKPIPPGATDNLRLWIDKSDIPRPFRTSKVTVVEVR
jgi:hypothetical protein